jgi:hypothetical protein
LCPRCAVGTFDPYAGGVPARSWASGSRCAPHRRGEDLVDHSRSLPWGRDVSIPKVRESGEWVGRCIPGEGVAGDRVGDKTNGGTDHPRLLLSGALPDGLPAWLRSACSVWRCPASSLRLQRWRAERPGSSRQQHLLRLRSPRQAG